MKRNPPENAVDFRQLGQTKIYFKKQDVTRFMTDLEIYKLDNFTIEFPSPNIVTMFLNSGETEYLKAKKIFETKIKLFLKENETNKLEYKEQVILYNYFERLQMSIICAYNSIEAFANLAIPENYEYSFKNHKGIKEVWNRDAIIRWMSLSDKLSKILPDTQKVNNPKKEKFWEDFKKLESLRNNIIHPKRHSSEPNVKHETFKKFFDKDFSKWIFSADKILKHFCNGEFREYYYPYGYGPKELETHEVEDMYEILKEIEE